MDNKINLRAIRIFGFMALVGVIAVFLGAWLAWGGIKSPNGKLNTSDYRIIGVTCLDAGLANAINDVIVNNKTRLKLDGDQHADIRKLSIDADSCDDWIVSASCSFLPLSGCASSDFNTVFNLHAIYDPVMEKIKVYSLINVQL